MVDDRDLYNIGRHKSFHEDYPYISPKTAYFNIIKRCNAGCKYCTDWTNDRNAATDPDKDTIQEILSDLRKLGVEQVVLSGGEPLLRNDILDIMSYGISVGLMVRLITNGTPITENKIREMAQIGVYKIAVSIDSLDHSRALSLRGLRLEQVVRAIERLCFMRNTEFPGLNISLYVTISRINIDDLVPLAEYANRLAIGIHFQPVHFAGTGIEGYILDNLWLDESDLIKLEPVLITLIEKKRSGYLIDTREDFLEQIPNFFRNQTFYPGDICSVAYTDVVIDTDLGVRPCWSMDPVAYLNANTSIQDIWSSFPMKDARSVIRQKQCPGCMYSCHINKSYVAFNTSQPSK